VLVVRAQQLQSSQVEMTIELQTPLAVTTLCVVSP
jgi:hypothetical protein